MGMGAPKPGSTFQSTPPQGGKGGGKPMQPQVPSQGGKAPVPMGGMLGGGGNPMQPGVPMQPQVQQPYRPIGLPPSQPTQVPAQGGKAPLTQEQIDAFKPNISPAQPMQPQVPAQGGKAPLTPEQQATLGNAINTRPMPQVMPMSPQQSPYGPYYDANGRPTAVGTGGPGLLMQPQVQQPAPSMPRPVPQVMPRQPAPKPAPLGLAQLQQMLRGRR
jgi:hypothetical protein